MKVLMVYDSFSPFGGGDQVATLVWLKNLRENGIDFKLLTDQKVKNLLNIFEDHELIINQTLNPIGVLTNYPLFSFVTKKTKQKIVDFNPDIVHIQEQLFLAYQVLKFVKSQKLKTLASYHTDAYNFRSNQIPFSLIVTKNGIGNKFQDWFQFHMLRRFDYITAPSVHFQKKVELRTGKKVFLLPSPISSSFFQEKKTTPQKISKIITISRLSGEKQVEVLVEMMRYLKDSFTLTIIGDGIERKNLEEKVKKLNLEKVVIFLGIVESGKVPKYLNAHDIFASASNFETFGMTYLEALASKLPVIIYDYATSREIIPNGMAVFVKSFDPKKWAEAILKLQENPRIYKQLKENIINNYSKIEKYSETESTKRLVEIYKQILSKA